MKKKFIIALTLISFAFSLAAAELLKKGEKGTYIIKIGGVELGYNTYLIEGKDETGYKTRSQTVLQLPQGEVILTTNLKLSPELIPLYYQLKATLPGQKQSIETTFTGNRAESVIDIAGAIRKVTTELAPPYYILDNNLIDHWVYLIKKLDLSGDISSGRTEFEDTGYYLMRKVYVGSDREQKLNIFVPQTALATTMTLRKKGKEELKIVGKSYTVMVLTGVLEPGVEFILYIDPGSNKLLKLVIPVQDASIELSSEVKPIK